MNTPSLPTIGTRVRMTAENSNWTIGDVGTITGHFDGGTGTPDRVGVIFPGQPDDCVAFPGDFEPVD